MAIYSDLTPLLDDIGLYFQIRDDLANLCSKEVRSDWPMVTVCRIL